MKTLFCPDCGKVFDEEPIPASCPNCGCPSSAFTSESDNVSPDLESSNNFAAEHTVNALAGVNLGIGIILGLGGVIAGIYFLASSGFMGDMTGTLCIIFGLLFFLMAILTWAFLKLLVNISYRLTRLDNKYNPK